MGQGEPRQGDGEVAEQQQIDVDHPGAVAGTTGAAADRALGRLASIEQGLGTELGADPQTGVEKLRLIEHEADGLGLIGRGRGENVDLVAGELGDRGLEVVPALSDVRTQPEVADHGRPPASRHTSTETSVTGSASGGSGLAALTQTALAS